MSTRSYIFKERDDGSYVGVHCHCDGYLTHNCAMLLDHYNSEKSVDWQGINDMYDDDSWRMTNYLSKEDDLGIGSEEIKAQADKVGIASKTRVSLNLIQNLAANWQKVLVWCLFTDTIEFVKKYLSDAGIKTVSIYGVDSPSERNKKISGFKSGHYQVLVTNPNTLAESVSLHMVCHNAIYLEYGFNLTYMLQSKNRINRV